MLKKITCTIILFILTHSLYAFDNIVVTGLFKNKAIIQIDGKQRLMSAGERSPEGVILIAANSREAIIEINDRRETLTLGAHIGSSYTQSTAQKTVSVAPDAQNMYWVNGSINEFQVKFVIDTGATLVSMNRHQARRIGLNYKMEGKPSMSSTASGMARIYLINLKKVKVGDIELNDVQGAVHDTDFPEHILLGNSFLSKVNMVREGSLLELKK